MSHLWLLDRQRPLRFSERDKSVFPRVSQEMIGGIAELDVDGGDPLEVMTDIQFVAHAHAAVKLHRLLADKARSLAHLRFRAGCELRAARLVLGQREIQMLG